MDFLRLIIDASVIIAFCKECRRPLLLQKLALNGFEIFTPRGVSNEIKQTDETYPPFKNLIKKKVVVITNNLDENEIADFNNRHPYLHQGEIEVILSGLKLKQENVDYLCAIDNGRARKVAKSYNLKLTGTLGLLDILTEINIVTSEEKLVIIHELKESGFRINKTP